MLRKDDQDLPSSTSKPETSDIQYMLTPDILVEEFEDVVN